MQVELLRGLVVWMKKIKSPSMLKPVGSIFRLRGVKNDFPRVGGGSIEKIYLCEKYLMLQQGSN